MSKKIEFIDLKAQYAALKLQIDARMQAVLDHGQFIMGPEVAELEEKLKTFTGSQHCITVSSGTEALLIALMALDIGCGDEVITSPFTFVSPAEVIALVGATPVFVDVNPNTCNIDAAKLKAAITPHTKAIIPISLYGQTADMDAINEVAGSIPVIEDAAQSFGAEYKGKKSCNLSTIGCTSFFPSKTLGCYGDGGAIFTNDDALAKAMREIRVHGQEKRYYHTRIGVGGRMDTLQCAIVLAKFEKFAWDIEQRLMISEIYKQMLQGHSKIQLLEVAPHQSCVWGQYTVQVEERDAVIAKLTEAGIPTAVHYPTPLHLQPAYKNISRIVGSLTHSEWLANRVLSLPMHPYLDEATQHRIADALITAVV